uniref:Uncharacterized protein n=1 Tax=Anguilla anguilla TaxID=7936 RepID=A0A0E9SPY4_ANGAN
MSRVHNNNTKLRNRIQTKILNVQ